MIAWYQGPKLDIETAKSGRPVALHACKNVCRLLTWSGGKFLLVGYPSRGKLRRGTTSSDDRFLSFNGFQYCLSPCYLYATIDDGDEKALLKAYRTFCDQNADPLLEAFLETRRASQRQSEEAVSFNEQTQRGKFLMVVTHEGKQLGQVVAEWRAAPSPTHQLPYCIVEFNKRKMVDDTYRLIMSFGNPPALAVAKRMVDNILSDFAAQLATKGVGFDHTLFESVE